LSLNERIGKERAILNDRWIAPSDFNSRGDKRMKVTQRIILALTVGVMVAAGAYAAPQEGLFAGKFSGKVLGGAGSSTELVLNLAQTGLSVNGTAALGSGLKADAGGFFICPGVVEIPSGTIGVSGTVSEANPSHLEARSGVSAMGLSIGLDVSADMSADGRTMNLQMKLNLPWPCSSPAFQATLTKLS
jgi:hypothetical protein